MVDKQNQKGGFSVAVEFSVITLSIVGVASFIDASMNHDTFSRDSY